VWGKGISQNVVWYVVKTCCERAGLEHIAPHDLQNLCQAVPHERSSWSRFNSYWAMHLSRRRNVIWAANRISDIRSTIFLTSQRTDGRMKTMLNLPQ
jgi:hypothetical protein